MWLTHHLQNQQHSKTHFTFIILTVHLDNFMLKVFLEQILHFEHLNHYWIPLVDGIVKYDAHLYSSI